MIKRTLYFGSPTYLSLKKEQLVIQLPEVVKNDSLPDTFKAEAVRTIPIEDIGIVILDNKQITITHGVIERLLANNCALITCSSNRMPVGLMLPLDGNTTQTERFRNQIDASMLFQTTKIQIFESNSQRSMCMYYALLSCFRLQRYKLLKAIHN